MANIVTKNQEAEPIEQYWNADQANVIKRLIAPGLTDDELLVFAHVCKKVNLDPFAKQIYAIKRGGRMCIQTGIDGFRLVAERSNKYAPGGETKFLSDNNGNLLGATVYVKKLTQDGTWHTVSATALLQEYNSNQGLWRKMPHVLIEKCAEARALRRAFPADLSGIYSDDEMDQADKKDTQDTEIKEEQKISLAKASEINKFLNGYHEIREGILKICKVEKIEDIKQSQLEACQRYAKVQIERIKKEKSNEDQNEKEIKSKDSEQRAV